MAKKPQKFVNTSLKVDDVAIGQIGDKLDIFPLSELAKKTAERDEQEAMIDQAVAISEGKSDNLSAEELDELIDGLPDLDD